MKSSTCLRRLVWKPQHRSVLSKRRLNTKSFPKIREEMLARNLPMLMDLPGPMQSILLQQTLSDFLPKANYEQVTLPRIGSNKSYPVPPGHHLVYFPPTYALSQLLPDGTDPSQSPGEPYTRRMWAGGRVRFLPAEVNRLLLSGKKAACLESIKEVQSKGPEGQEKLFVTIERRFGHNKTTLFMKQKPKEIRSLLEKDEHCSIIEERDIVFMRDHDGTPAPDGKTPAPRRKALEPPYPDPDFSHSMTPTAGLLFRFSALTWNAHQIHLNEHYCRTVEGHRNLLFHGPLSLVCMLEMTQRQLAEKYGIWGRSLVNHIERPRRRISSIEYRNLAPLYAEEELKICGKEEEDQSWTTWIENKDGNLAVKATIQTEPQKGRAHNEDRATVVPPEY